jgi:hypothetical protein
MPSARLGRRQAEPLLEIVAEPRDIGISDVARDLLDSRV